MDTSFPMHPWLPTLGASTEAIGTEVAYPGSIDTTKSRSKQNDVTPKRRYKQKKLTMSHLWYIYNTHNIHVR